MNVFQALKRNLPWIAGVLLLPIAVWSIVAAYQHHKRMSWRPPPVRLNAATVALRKQLAAAVAEGTGISNSAVRPNEDDHLKRGADPEELKKGRQIGEAIISGDYTAFEKLKEMSAAETKAYQDESKGWSHEQYNELAIKERLRIFEPSGFAEDIWIRSCLRGDKPALKGMDYAFQVPELRGYQISFLGMLARRGNQAALEVFLNATKYNVPFSLAISPLKSAADGGNEKAIEALAAVCANEKDRPWWFMVMDALSKASAAGNETAINALITLSTDKNQGVSRMAVAELQTAADNHSARAAAALETLNAQGLVEPNARAESNNLRQQMARVVAEALAAKNTAGQPAAATNAIPNNGNPEVEKCLQLGEAIVSGGDTAMKWLLEFANPPRGSVRSNSVAPNDAPWSDLPRRALSSLWVTFKVLDAAAASGNTNVLAAIAEAIQTPGLQGFGVESLGVLAGNGNDAAVEILINPKKYGLLLSSSVGSLKNAADSGNQKAIDALAAVAADKQNRGLWYMTAESLQKAAASGNSVAIDALITLSATDSLARDTAIEGLKEAAANHNAKAAAALEKLNTQP